MGRVPGGPDRAVQPTPTGDRTRTDKVYAAKGRPCEGAIANEIPQPDGLRNCGYERDDIDCVGSLRTDRSLRSIRASVLICTTPI